MITAKLSQKFYDTFGDDITNELVTWFNDVDATYRADLRDLNETNFARFDAKLEQRLAEADAKWEGRWHRLGARFAALESRPTRRKFPLLGPTPPPPIGTAARGRSPLLRPLRPPLRGPPPPGGAPPAAP